MNKDDDDLRMDLALLRQGDCRGVYETLGLAINFVESYPRWTYRWPFGLLWMLNSTYRDQARSLDCRANDMERRVELAEHKWQKIFAVILNSPADIPEDGLRSVSDMIKEHYGPLRESTVVVRQYFPSQCLRLERLCDRMLDVAHRIDVDYPWPNEQATQVARHQYETGSLMDLETFTNELQRASRRNTT